MSNTRQETRFKDLADRFLDCYSEGELPPVPIGVRLIPKGMEIPMGLTPSKEYLGMPWCQAIRVAEIEKEAIVLDQTNIGCPAAAISLGLVDAYDEEPLGGKRRYTDLMAKTPASPADFTTGRVYACKDSDHMQFALFGDKDVGRYETLGKAMHAIQGMKAIQPAIMKAAVVYPAGYLDLTPDVVILAIKPKQALLAIQGYNFLSGDRFHMSTIGIRGVCADLTAAPYLEQRLNGSFLCLGARALGGWEGEFVGLGIPFTEMSR